MDDLLATSVLDDIEARHWSRYKMTWPPDIAPADTVISRIVRELEKRTLSVREVLKIKTQAHQQKAVTKRTKVAVGLDMVSSSADQASSPTLHNYLSNLLTLMIAYSKAGSKPRCAAFSKCTRKPWPTRAARTCGVLVPDSGPSSTPTCCAAGSAALIRAA